jgi:hypothetical protein
MCICVCLCVCVYVCLCVYARDMGQAADSENVCLFSYDRVTDSVTGIQRSMIYLVLIILCVGGGGGGGVCVCV